MPKAILLFDVDGTLMLAGGATRRAIEATLHALFGRGSLAQANLAGSLDHQIFCELAGTCGITDPHPYLARYKQRYLQELRRDLEQNRDKVRILPGVRELLTALSRRGDVLVGLLTGNYREGVEIKLAAAGIAIDQFRIGAFAEDGACRGDLVHAAVAQASAYLGETCSAAQAIVIGDTPRDIDCARETGAQVLAVATGQYSLEQLLAYSPDAAVTDLTDSAKLDELIRSARGRSSGEIHSV